MKKIILALLLCVGCFPDINATNIDEDVAEQFACGLYADTVNQKTEWKENGGSEFIAEIDGQRVYLDQNHIRLFLDKPTSSGWYHVKIKNKCQSKLFKYIIEHSKNEYEQGKEAAVKEFFKIKAEKQ